MASMYRGELRFGAPRGKPHRRLKTIAGARALARVGQGATQVHARIRILRRDRNRTP
jgi:hypothetical protein